MKKLLIGIVLLLAVFGYAYFSKGSVPSVPAVPNQSSSGGGSSNTNTGTPKSAASGSVYKDGTYTGNVTDAFYGNIQVKATISGGKITDVVFLQYPNDRDDSISINNAAMPQLKQEAITVQNANVDTVSGATQTSQAFIQSLQSALDKAKS